MNDLSLLKILVAEWTQKAQNSTNTDAERSVYYECAQKLHESIQHLEEGGLR
jgi:hypothetical protein